MRARRVRAASELPRTRLGATRTCDHRRDSSRHALTECRRSPRKVPAYSLEARGPGSPCVVAEIAPRCLLGLAECVLPPPLPTRQRKSLQLIIPLPGNSVRAETRVGRASAGVSVAAIAYVWAPAL